MKSSNYKVLHISTSHTGGAGIAARRLNQGLNASGTSSSFLTTARTGFSPNVNEFVIERRVIFKIQSVVIAKFNSNLNQKTYFTIASKNALKLKDLKKMLSHNNSILHIHNWFNFFNPDVILPLLSEEIPVVFTLHDMRLFTGGCHYSLDCYGYKTNCSNCQFLSKFLNSKPSKNLAKMKDALKSHSNQIKFIAPSKWIMEKAQESTLLKDRQIYFIPNYHGIEYKGEISSKVNSRNSNQELNIGIASFDPTSYLKGGDLSLKLIEAANHEYQKIKFKFLKQFQTVNTNSDNFWAEIDYLLVLSRADNSPNVIHEAKLQGIPVISSMVGGISELLNPEIDILISPNEFNEKDILNVIVDLSLNADKYKREGLDPKYKLYTQDSLKNVKALYESFFH